MKLERVDNKYVISNMDLEMVQFILNSLYKETNKLKDKISVINKLLFKDYSETQKEEFREEIEFLKQRNIEVNEHIEYLTKEFERIIA